MIHMEMTRKQKLTFTIFTSDLFWCKFEKYCHYKTPHYIQFTTWNQKHRAITVVICCIPVWKTTFFCISLMGYRFLLCQPTAIQWYVWSSESNSGLNEYNTLSVNFAWKVCLEVSEEEKVHISSVWLQNFTQYSVTESTVCQFQFSSSAA